MARSSWSQTNFLGGEWSVSAQGRLDLPEYRTALAKCLNAYPQEEGSVTLRSGTRMCGPTYNGQFGLTLSWDVYQATVYDVEITLNFGAGSIIRIWQGDQPVLDATVTLASVTQTFPAVFQLSSPVTWQTKDTVMMEFSGAVSGTTQWAPVLNRQLIITMIDSTHFTATDIFANPIDGTQFPSSSPPVFVGHIYQATVSQWTTTNQLFQLCPVATNFQNNQLFILCANAQPVVITMTTGPSIGVWPTFSTTTAFFQGPYQSLEFNQNGTLSSTSPGTVTLTSTGVAPNSGLGFVSSDVGRAIRFLSRPPQYNSGTTYAQGNAATFNNVAYTSLAGSNVGNQPNISPTKWAVDQTNILYFDTKILSVVDGANVTLNLSSQIPAGNGTTIAAFQLGIYSASGQPSCGTFHEGRLWLGGSTPNQFDASEITLEAGGITLFRPTDQNGNVLDDSAVSYYILSPRNNQFIWMTPDQGGVLIGTAGEEWLVTATNQNLVITPTTVQAHRQSTFGSYSSHQPIHTGPSLVFIDRWAGLIYEYLVDVFAQRFGAIPLNSRAKKVTGPVNEGAYVSNPTPIVWMRGRAGNLSGCTYRRTSRFLSQPPDFHGWHSHVIAGVAPALIGVQQISTNLLGGDTDVLSMITAPTITSTTGFLRQILMPPYDPNLGDRFAWQLDGAYTGLYTGDLFTPNVMVGLTAVEDGTNMYFLGLWNQPAVVSVYLGGIYFGEYPVVNGAITVPYGSDPAGLGTRANLALGLLVPGTNGGCAIQGLGTIACCIGTKFTSTIKMLRQDVAEEARTQAGMAVGDTRRPYRAAATIAVGYNNMVQVGVDNQPAYPMIFRQYIDGLLNANNQPFSGVWQDTVNGDESYDGQLTLTITGPYPFTLNNLTPFTETEER